MARLVGRSNIRARLDRIERVVREIKDYAHEEFRATTPIRTGNARNKTKRISQGVEADYPYANRLNAGYSRQAPAGMTDPVVRKISDRIRRM